MSDEPQSIEESQALFKRGFEVSDSIHPGLARIKRFEGKYCRSCYRKFTPDAVADGQHICPHCHERNS